LSLARPFGSGSLAFAAPPSTFSRHRVGPRGLSWGSGFCRTSLQLVSSSTSASPSALSLCAGPLGPPLLAPSAWSSPPTRARASTPRSPRGSPSVGPLPRGRSRSVSAVSHRPDGLLRSCFAGLFHPAAGPRFTVFRPPLPLRVGWVLLTARLVPFEECPSSVAVPRHRGPCLLAVSACPRPCSPSGSLEFDRSSSASPLVRRS
jgi:hypothetical protein